jgi:hypothetical protein
MAAFALTIFTGAFLLFQVQPIIGKFILPWFGGSPGVWTTCMLFFQVLLLGGYAYAHASASRLKPRTQVATHLAIVLLSLAFLPVIPGAGWKPVSGDAPVTNILLLLAANVGLPYFALAATGPLVQHWFGCVFAGRSPYRLYALSNVGSLLALLSYPFVFEPLMSRRTQAWSWSAGLVLYLLCILLCARKIWQSEAVRALGEEISKGPAADPGSVPGGAVRPSRWIAGLWLLLPACASALLLAVTNKLCLDVAVFPFLWIVPLALYLLSFIVAFDSPRWYRRGPFTLLLVVALAGFCWALYEAANWDLWWQVAVFGSGLFIFCMVCHGELYRLRPDPSQLTRYYLFISAGGALGGIFVGVLAPFLFNDYYELHLSLGLSALLYAALFWRDALRMPPGAAAPDRLKWMQTVSWLLPLLGLAALEIWIWKSSALFSQIPKEVFYALRFLAWAFLGLLMVSALMSTSSGQRLSRILAGTWLSLSVAGLGIVLGMQAASKDADIVYTSRNFYGVLTVFDHRQESPQDRFILLRHGRITHGLQFTRADYAKLPTTYYSTNSGVGMAINALPERPRRIGMVGLGTGTLATYGRAGDTLRIYEIDPEVVELARTRFSYLSNCPAKIEIVPGDARLSLEREAPQQFDLLALDAFSGDAVPVHLLTREAFAVYERHMATNGVLAIHISNHFLDLEPVVVNLARDVRRGIMLIDPDDDEEQWWIYGSTWALMSRQREFYNRPEFYSSAVPFRTNAPVIPLWRDDFASLFQILRKP